LMAEDGKPAMTIVGGVRKWWAQRNAVPEEKTKLVRERIERLFDESREEHSSSGHKKREGQPPEPVHATKT
jgi:hypothetical protein